MNLLLAKQKTFNLIILKKEPTTQNIPPFLNLKKKKKCPYLYIQFYTILPILRWLACPVYVILVRRAQDNALRLSCFFSIQFYFFFVTKIESSHFACPSDVLFIQVPALREMTATLKSHHPVLFC